MVISLHDKVTIWDVKNSPFPYLVIKDILPRSLCDQLIAEYPKLEEIGVDHKANNKRWSYCAKDVAQNSQITESWKQVIHYFSSDVFYHELVNLLGDSVSALYPKRFPDKKSLGNLRPGIRKVHDYNEKDILLDAQICGNTPVTEAMSVRTNHVDSPLKLISGLLYLRTDDDDSVGGDLELRKFKSNYSQSKKTATYQGVYVDSSHTEICDVVNCEKNVLILFVNSIESFHGVSPRLPTQHNRIFINIVVTVQKPLFGVPEPLGIKIRKSIQYQRGLFTLKKNKAVVWLKSLKWLRKIMGKSEL